MFFFFYRLPVYSYNSQIPTMATSQQALCCALTLIVILAVSSSLVCLNYTPPDGVLITDHFGISYHGYLSRTCQFRSIFHPDFHQFSPAFRGLYTRLHSTLDQLYYPPWLMTQPKPLWLELFIVESNTTQYNGLINRQRLSRNRTSYYANTTATFNVILAGDVELNPGPESSGTSTTLATRYSQDDACLRVYQQNVRSLKNKLDVYHTSLVAHLQPGGVFNFFALTEAVLDAELNIPDYTIFRNDRSHKRGGSVLLGCHNDFECRRRPEVEQDNLELLWVEVRLSSRNKMLLGVFYRPPNSGVQTLEALADCLTNASRYYNTICIVGDFNLPSLQWHSDNGPPWTMCSLMQS